MRAIHGPRSGTLEIDSFRIVAAAMARALEFVFAGLPFRSASQVGAAREDHEDAVRFANHPDTIGHQVALVDSQAEIAREADGKNSIGFIQGARKKKAQGHQKI